MQTQELDWLASCSPSHPTTSSTFSGGLPEGGLHPRLGPGHVQREAAGVPLPAGSPPPGGGQPGASPPPRPSPPRGLVPAQPLPPVGIRSLRGSFSPPAASPPGSGRRGDGGLQTPTRPAPRPPPRSGRQSFAGAAPSRARRGQRGSEGPGADPPGSRRRSPAPHASRSALPGSIGRAAGPLRRRGHGSHSGSGSGLRGRPRRPRSPSPAPSPLRSRGPPGASTSLPSPSGPSPLPVASAGSRAARAAQAVTQGGGGRSRRRRREQMALKKTREPAARAHIQSASARRAGSAARPPASPSPSDATGRRGQDRSPSNGTFLLSPGDLQTRSARLGFPPPPPTTPPAISFLRS